ncbi:MAG: MliC family protein [Parvibaculum sp.]|jgi:membrane-bound inhibitor of C-type lysozyme|uniref:MliC family protein n=1 Tax=Parvibaculum sp. TaxID=2024848 RepID=UPI003918F52F
MKLGAGLVLAAALALSACGDDSAKEAAGEAHEPSRYDALSITYLCEGGVRVQAIYFNFEDGNALAALSYDGTLAPMRIMPSGSGAKYTSLNEELGWRWHTKGDEASLSYMAPDDTATEQPVLQSCTNILHTGGAG